MTVLPALAQGIAVVAARDRVNWANEDWQECTVAARLGNKDELMVVAQNLTVGTRCAVSEDGGETFCYSCPLPFADPGVVVDPSTDRFWLSGVGACTSPCLNVAWRDPGASTLASCNWEYPLCCQNVEGDCEDEETEEIEWPCDLQPAPVCVYPAVFRSAGFLDKPLMAIGSGGRHFTTYLHDPSSGACNTNRNAWAGYSDDPMDTQEWTDSRIEPDDPVGCEFEGWGAKPVVLDDGRVVVVFRGYDAGYNDGLPVVAYSDSDGESWLPNDDEPVPVAEGGNVVNVAPFNNSGSGDTPYYIDQRKCAPDIAVDRTTDRNDVYVAFYARAERNDDEEADKNSDIYISRSIDGGESFPGDNPNHLVQLTDEMLGLETDDDGPDQIMPSIAVDPCGGVNLVFYDNRDDDDRTDDDHWLDLYYVRITDYGGDNDIQQVRLTPNSFTLPSTHFLGHYHHMALAGPQPTLYPAWMAIETLPTGTRRSCFVNKISIVCSEELSGFSGSEEEACALWEELVSSGRIEGDLDGDDDMDADDEEIFFTALGHVKTED